MPRKCDTPRQRLSVSIPAELMDQIRMLAREEERNTSNMVTVILRDALPDRINQASPPEATANTR